MIRVVIDTNVLVSALLQPEGLPAAVWMLALSGRVQPCVSDAVLAEYEDVIRRPHFKRDAETIEETLQAVRKAARHVKPTMRAGECSDPDDNIFLECAEAAHADYLVTGNQRHFPDQWKKTRVIGVREFIEILIQQEDWKA
jgi:putative PIN family toxin of toxin-antitoxin system